MKQLSSFKTFLFYSMLFPILFLIVSCNKENGASNIAGTYLGTATVEEQVLRDGMVVFDTSFTTTEQLVVTAIDVANREYHFELMSAFKTYYNQSPLEPTRYFLDDNYTVWEGLDEYGYTYDNKKHWIFDPQQDTVYFYLAHAPYESTVVDNPDSIGHSYEELHTWNYVLRAEH